MSQLVVDRAVVVCCWGYQKCSIDYRKNVDKLRPDIATVDLLCVWRCVFGSLSFAAWALIRSSKLLGLRFMTSQQHVTGLRTRIGYAEFVGRSSFDSLRSRSWQNENGKFICNKILFSQILFWLIYLFSCLDYDCVLIINNNVYICFDVLTVFV